MVQEISNYQHIIWVRIYNITVTSQGREMWGAYIHYPFKNRLDLLLLSLVLGILKESEHLQNLCEGIYSLV